MDSITPRRRATRRTTAWLPTVALALAATMGAVTTADATGAVGDACPAGRAEASTGELTDVRVAGLPVVDFAPIYYAAACGMFAAHGLDVTVETVQGGTVGAQLLTSGDVDFTIVSWFGFIEAVGNGAPLVGVANSTLATADTNYIFAAPGSDINTAEDLVGAMLGVNTTSSVGDISTTALLRSLGIEGDPQWVPTPLPEILPAIQSGAIDGGHLAEPFVTAAEAAGLVPVVDIFDGPMAGLPIAGYATLTATVADQPELVSAFRAGIDAATDLLADDDAALRSFVLSFASMPPELAPQITLPQFTTDLAGADVQGTADVMATAGFLAEPLDITPHLAAAG